MIIFSVLMFFWVSSCTSQNTKVLLPEEAPRLLETKAQIKTPQESNTVKIQIALWPQRAIRMEVTATLGMSVATVLMTGRQIKLALHSQKTFIEGPFHEKTLYPVFKQNISPRLIWKIIHDQNVSCIYPQYRLPAFLLPLHLPSFSQWLHENVTPCM